MANYTEGAIAIIVCLAVFNFALIGIVIYGIIHMSQMMKESKDERFKVKVLIESMTEIFESKYQEHDNENKGGIGPGA